MISSKTILAGTLAAVWTIAGNAAATPRQSCAVIERTNLTRCVLSSNLTIEAERWAQAAAKGRVKAASPLLPSNPVLELAAKRRTNDATSQTTTNWSASLSQELEFSGGRSARREAAQADVDAQRWRETIVIRDIAARAWGAYFEILTARKQLQLAQSLEGIGSTLQRVSKARAEHGVGTPMDADLADLAAVKATQSRANAERQLRVAELELRELLALDAKTPLTISGDLLPLDGVQRFSTTLANSPARPEQQMLDAERQAELARAKVYRRSRVPNLTLRVFAERDGFDEQVFGVGLALPVPLPHPLGRTQVGEIEEAEALARRASTLLVARTREQLSALAATLTEYESRRQEAGTFTAERVVRAQKALADISTEVDQGRISVRDALSTQQLMIDFLQQYVAAQLALCLASLQLARAAGFPFERGES